MVARQVNKVIVIHRGAARDKYGGSGWTAIRHAVTALIDADAERGLRTRLLALDSVADARTVEVPAVTDVSDSAATKAFVDGVFAKYDPAYLLLLGGPELVATVPLGNPLWDGTAEGDPDPVIASDLPYACAAPYSTSASSYPGPARVVGRIPDLIGEVDPSVLVGQLNNAAGAAVVAAPTKVFALSTRTWRSSTATSMSKLPIPMVTVRTSPSDGPAWTATDLGPPVHFVNCHGGEFDPHWYGEARPGAMPLPVAVDGATVGAKVAAGTVAAAECCYGAAHWAPAAAAGSTSVALSYLGAGAIGFFGAATTAYGPATGNEYADVIAGFFIAEVLGGASLGRAALTARQRYVQAEGFLDPTSLTTLAQFTLFGDPSVQPFAQPSSAPVAEHATAQGVVAKGVPQLAGLLQRRAQLNAIGQALQASTSVSSDAASRTSRLSASDLATLCGLPAAAASRVRSFPATGPTSTNPRTHVAFVPGRAGNTLVVVREAYGGQPEVRIVHAKTAPVTVTGAVSLRRVATGSKSERDTVVITVGDRHWELRRAGTGAFDRADPRLVALVGTTVTVTGYSGSGVFVVTDLPD